MGKYKDKYKKLKECYEFNCKELNRVTMELVEAKCELDKFKEENLRLYCRNNSSCTAQDYINYKESL